MSEDLITPEARALIGASTPWTEAPHPIEASEVRRFIQASLLPWPATAPQQAPVGFVLHMFRQPMALATDPLAAGGDAEYDGTHRRFRHDMPPVPTALRNVVNGGYDHEFYSHALVGERIIRRSRYKDIYQRDSKSGPMVLVVIEDEYRTAEQRPLQRSSNVFILK